MFLGWRERRGESAPWI